MGRPLVFASLLTAVAVAGGCTGPRPSVRTAETTTTATTATTPPAPERGSSCAPSPAHPEPVVLLHGTFGVTSWGAMANTLSGDGYCVFPFDYGNGGTDEIGRSAAQLSAFVDDVLRRTGAARVSIVGHSQAGLMARYYVKFLGGSGRVDDLIALSPPNHGTKSLVNFPVPVTLTGCDACAEQRAGSSFLAHLNADDETPAPVDYTVVQTRYDAVVFPFTSAFLNGPPDRVTNITLQELCPDDFAGHLDIPSDPVALQWVQNALARPGPADPSRLPRC